MVDMSIHNLQEPIAKSAYNLRETNISFSDYGQEGIRDKNLDYDCCSARVWIASAMASKLCVRGVEMSHWTRYAPNPANISRDS